MNKLTDASRRPSCWQVIFLQSKVNGARYEEERLPELKWDWPQNTYLQRRLRKRNESLIRSQVEIEQSFREADAKNKKRQLLLAHGFSNPQFESQEAMPCPV